MAARKVVFMFSGQGSHSYQMGRALYDQLPAFRERLDILDIAARRAIGRSVIAALYHEKHLRNEPFDRVLLSHPAIYMVECALAHALIEAGVRPDIVLGVSLGMFAAAEVAGCLNGSDALASVISQARLLREHCSEGNMYAVLSHPSLYERSGLCQLADFAGGNFDAHFVISTERGRAAAVEAELSARGVTWQKLAVSYAFHSRWIEPLRSPFEAHVRALEHLPAAIPVACCAGIELMTRLPPNHLWQVIRRPIHFQQTIEYLEEYGEYLYIDVGPSGTLATFVKYLLRHRRRSRSCAVLSPFGHDLQNFQAALCA